MTNQSPQEPQNPISERRKRAAAGLTFDEMIGIFVAFTTIGAILFWSLGGRKGKFANNTVLNKGSGLLSANNTGANFFGNIGIGGKKSNLDSAQIDSKAPKFNAQLSESEPVPLDISEKKAVSAKPVKSKAYKKNNRNKRATFAGGIAASTALLNGGIGNASDGIKSTIDKAKPKVSKPKVDANKPKASEPKKPVAVPADIAPTYWAYPFVKQMSDKGLVPKLTGDKNFEPDKPVTRAGMATLISNAFETKPETQGIKQFQDVSDENAVAADVDKAIKIGFMKGYSENTFRPTQKIPRYQVLVALATGLKLKPSGDPEATLKKLKNGTDIPDWAKNQVAAAAESGLIVNRPGFETGDLKPNESATRGEVAAMIHQALVNSGKLKSLNSEYILKP